MNNHRAISYLLVVLCAAFSFSARAQDMPTQYQEALNTPGKQGDFKSNVLKINIQRKDLTVTVDGVATPTPFGFRGWLAMTKGDDGMHVMMGGPGSNRR